MTAHAKSFQRRAMPFVLRKRAVQRLVIYNRCPRKYRGSHNRDAVSSGTQRISIKEFMAVPGHVIDSIPTVAMLQTLAENGGMCSEKLLQLLRVFLDSQIQAKVSLLSGYSPSETGNPPTLWLSAFSE